MRLSKEKQDEILNHLNNLNRKGAGCAICGSSILKLAEDVYALPALRRNTVAQPLLTLFCGSCGHVRFVNPIIAGLDLDLEDAK